MKTNQIFIIATRNQGGRYIKTATTNEARAEQLAARLVKGLGALEWELKETQIIPDGEQLEPIGAGVPDVIKVYHLSNYAGDWCNVELYRVDNITENV